MAFIPRQGHEGKEVEIELVTSAAVAKHDVLADDGNGLFQRATSSSTKGHYVALEAVTSASALQKIMAYPAAMSDIRFEADTQAAVSQTDVGTNADLTDHDTLNENASSNDVFYIESIIGAAGTSQKVYGYFLDKTS